MPKRAISYTPSDMEDEDRKPLLQPISDANVKKTSKSTASAPSTPKKAKKELTASLSGKVKRDGEEAGGSPSKGSATPFPAEAKKVLVERAMELAYKGLPYAELARELGISEQRLKSQMKPGRSNLRKTIVDLCP
ncbi:hypothetical protein IAU59_000620 [Kwoniella sp. CBS 9459]